MHLYMCFVFPSLWAYTAEGFPFKSVCLCRMYGKINALPPHTHTNTDCKRGAWGGGQRESDLMHPWRLRGISGNFTHLKWIIPNQPSNSRKKKGEKKNEWSLCFWGYKWGRSEIRHCKRGDIQTKIITGFVCGGTASTLPSFLPFSPEKGLPRQSATCSERRLGDKELNITSIDPQHMLLQTLGLLSVIQLSSLQPSAELSWFSSNVLLRWQNLKKCVAYMIILNFSVPGVNFNIRLWKNLYWDLMIRSAVTPACPADVLSKETYFSYFHFVSGVFSPPKIQHCGLVFPSL